MDYEPPTHYLRGAIDSLPAAEVTKAWFFYKRASERKRGFFYMVAVAAAASAIGTINWRDFRVRCRSENLKFRKRQKCQNP